MSNVAIGSDGERYYANELDALEMSELYCIDENCKCRLMLKNIAPNEKTTRVIPPYFSATKKNNHAEGCLCKSTAGIVSKLCTEDFSLQDFFGSIQKSNSKEDATNRKAEDQKNLEKAISYKISTVYRLWSYCYQHSDSHIIPNSDGVTVGQVYQAKRNRDMPLSQRNAERIIMLGFRNCNFKLDKGRGTYNIWCYFPHNETEVPPARYYILGFEERCLGVMVKLCRKLNRIKEQKGHAYIVAGGEWDGMFCRITSPKQIHILTGQDQKI